MITSTKRCFKNQMKLQRCYGDERNMCWIYIKRTNIVSNTFFSVYLFVAFLSLQEVWTVANNARNKKKQSSSQRFIFCFKTSKEFFGTSNSHNWRELWKSTKQLSFLYNYHMSATFTKGNRCLAVTQIISENAYDNIPEMHAALT